MFQMKCQFKESPFSFLIIMTLTNLVSSAYLTRVFERAFYNTDPVIDSTMTGFQDYDNFLNVLWLTAVTMTTVGFGDYYCKSDLGRFMATLVTMFGILLVSLMLVSLERSTKLNQFQALSYEFVFKLQAREKIRHHSAIVVAEMFRIGCLKKRLRALQERKTQL